MPFSRRDTLKIAASLSLLPLARALGQSSPGLLVFAAASLTDVITALGNEFQAKTGVPVRASFAASSALARQLEAGAPADLFFSADVDWMDDVAAHGLIRPQTRVNLVGNSLVLIAPRASTLTVQIEAGSALADALGDAHWVTGDPDSVPVGRYAQAALRNLGVWDALAPHLVRADNVRAALALVARGEVRFGIVYATDAAVDSAVRVVATFPARLHPPILYPVALLRDAAAPAADFLAYLRTPAAMAVFRRFGFTALQP